MRKIFGSEKNKRQITYRYIGKIILSVALAATVVVAQSAYTVNVLAASVEDCDLDGFDDYTGNPVPWIGFDSTKGQEIPSDWDGKTTYKSKKDYEDSHKKQGESKEQTSTSSGSTSGSTSSSSDSSTTQSNTATNKTTSSGSSSKSSATQGSSTSKNSASKSSTSSQKSTPSKSSKSSNSKKSASKSTASKDNAAKNTASKSDTAEEKNTVEQKADSVKDDKKKQEEKQDKKEEAAQNPEETEVDTIEVVDNTQEINAGQEDVALQQDVEPIQEAEEFIEDIVTDTLLDGPVAEPEVANSFLKALTVGFSPDNKGLIPGIAILIALAAGGIVTVLFSSVLGRK